ncbi:MAG: hypothetical protein FJ288_14160 [Planctomycetes bacterium]|nr:hypothetical protein [Planctomycetota bacterium]
MTKDPDPAGIVPGGDLDRATDPEYAAISTKAVMAAAFSVVGAAAFLAAPFIMMPVVGILLGLLALRQIRSSAGVLAGRGIAWAAVGAGAAVAIAAAAYHGHNWLAEHRMFSDLENRSYQVIDDIAAGRYADVYALMPEEFRRRQGAGPEQFRARLAPLMKDAGSIQRRALVTLQVTETEDGQVLAPAEMHVDLERRRLRFTIWFKQAADGKWELVGVAGEAVQEGRQHSADAPEPHAHH